MARSKICASAWPGQQDEVPNPACLAGGVSPAQWRVHLSCAQLPMPLTTLLRDVHHPNASASLCPVTPESQHGCQLAGTFNKREAPSSCSHLGKSPWLFICIGLYMVPDGCSVRLEEARRAGRQWAKSWEEKKRCEGCTQAANEPVGERWVSQACPALLQTLVSPSRWELCSCFMLFWHGGYHGEHYSKEMHPFFFCFMVNNAAVWL